jgi:ribosomal protein S17
MVATYLGMTWWDNESDGDKLYPKQQHDPSQDEEQQKLLRNPEGASLRGLWSDLEFLADTGTREFNSQLKHTQFADFHSHGWLFRKVFKRDRKGNLLDADDKLVSSDDPDKFKKAVHLNDIHLEKGMHCVDCHFRQDAHGDGNLYNEPRAAIEITCEDCHGSIRNRATLFTSGPAAAEATGTTAERRKTQNQPLVGQDLTRTIRVRDETGTKIPLFQKITRDRTKKDESGKDIALKIGDIVQNSMVVPGRWWRVIQTVDTITAGSRDYSEKSRYSKTMRKDNVTWGDVPKSDNELAHSDTEMTCVACHSSWVTSCFGCHLSMQANRKMPNRHNEGGDSRNYTQYNFQVLRDDIFMLGRDSTVAGNRVAPVRSSSAVLVSSQNQNREWIYSQQQTTSAEGFAGQAFNTHVPHTVRAKETKACSDCHVSNRNDNNAWLAQLLLQGTNFVNFMGRYVYVAADDALEAVVATERDEPQAVIGSSLHRIAYPDNYEKFVKGGSELSTVYEHVGNPRVLQVQLRGEYAYVAAGEGGLRVYDVAQIDQKGFSERIVTAPVSRFGQKFWVKTKYATAVAAPTTLAVDPARWRMKIDGTMIDPVEAAKLTGEARKQLVNEEQPIHPLYAYLYVVDKYEGLILVNAATLLDGDPLNNYLKRALNPAKFANGAFNPGGALNDANNVSIAGHYAYITSGQGLVVVDIDDPLSPRIVKQIGAPELRNPRAIAIQFRYAFVVDDDGLKVLDVTVPDQVRVIAAASVPLGDAHDVYVARTYAYVANGKEGIAIIDVEQPEKPWLDQIFSADGKLNDVHQVKVAMTNASLFGYVADGRNGLRVLQLTSPETMPEYAGFSPRPKPVLIATFKTKGEALGISKPLDRDRAVDESGNQVSVFGRRGARPFNFDEIMRMLRTDDGHGDWFTVSDAPATQSKN